MPAPHPARLTFWRKPLAAAALAALADRLLYGHGFGTALGVFALAWVVAVAATRPAVRRDRRALLAAAIAGLFALALIDRPGLVAWSLFWIALGSAALLPRTGAFDDVWRWAQRLTVQAVGGIWGPLGDLGRLRRLERLSGRRGPSPTALLGVLALPLVGGAVFLALFAAANPIIADLLGRVRLPAPDLVRWIFWASVGVAVWATLRPHSRRELLPLIGGGVPGPLPGVTVASVGLSLALFNALFAVQNGLDLAFLWSGAGLPEGVTLAEYAHRGAYPLIATALLAGLFVLVALRPGSDTAANPLCRRLVVLWVVQNMFLVASSVLRTLDYVEVYSLTRLRLAALAWMVLVAVGLALIGWRLLRGKSGAWLINANALAAGLALAAATVVDLGAVAAHWNVRNAREAGGRGTALDLCYLNRLDGAALTALAELETKPGEPQFKARVAAVRGAVQRRVEARQADWRDWTWRDARRVEAARALVGGAPASTAISCDGAPIVPAQARPAPHMGPPWVVTETPVSDAPLTSEAQP